MNGNMLNIEQMHNGERPVPDNAGREIKKALSLLENSDKEILEQYPAADMKLEIMKKMGKGNFSDKSGSGRHRIFRFSAVAAGRIAAVAAVLCFAVLIPAGINFTYRSGMGTEESVRVKGGARLFVYRQNGTEAEILSSGAAASAGDVVQLSYVAAGAKYGVIFSVDGNGIITRHYPDEGTSAGKLTAGKEVALPFSYKLDDAPGYERFVFFYSEKQFPISVLAAIENGAVTGAQGIDFDFNDLIPRSINVADFVLIK